MAHVITREQYDAVSIMSAASQEHSPLTNMLADLQRAVERHQDDKGLVDILDVTNASCLMLGDYLAELPTMTAQMEYISHITETLIAGVREFNLRDPFELPN